MGLLAKMRHFNFARIGHYYLALTAALCVTDVMLNRCSRFTPGLHLMGLVFVRYVVSPLNAGSK